MLFLEENPSSNYKDRTKVNAESAAITIAIAVDFETAGEKLTKKLVKEAGNLYIPVSPIGDVHEKAKKIVELINKTFTAESGQISVNIAGNGIYSLKEKLDQEDCNDFTYALLSDIIDNKAMKFKIGEVRSGGQSGMDESGIMAGIDLGIEKVIAHFPKGYKYRNIDGKDIIQTREEALKRFATSMPIVDEPCTAATQSVSVKKIEKERLFVDMDNVLCDYKKAYLSHTEKFPKVIFPQSQYGFFAGLEPMPDAIESFHKLSEVFDIWILTAPSCMNPFSYAEKNVWVKKHLGYEYVKKLILCPNKSLLKGKFLIDDNHDTNFQKDFEGTLILFGSGAIAGWKEVLKFFKL